VLPVLVLLIMRKPSFGKTLTVILSILVFGILIRWSIFRHLQPLLSASDNSAYFTTYIEKIYYPTYTRLDGLLMGVTLAIIKTFRPAWWQKLMASGYAALGLGFTCSAGAIWILRDRFSLAGMVAKADGKRIRCARPGLYVFGGSDLDPSRPLFSCRYGVWFPADVSWNGSDCSCQHQPALRAVADSPFLPRWPTACISRTKRSATLTSSFLANSCRHQRHGSTSASRSQAASLQLHCCTWRLNAHS
jgi:hypothetical protein